MSKKSVRRNIGLFFVGVLLAAGFVLYRFTANLEPLPPGPPQLIRYRGRQPLSTALHDLETRQIIRSAAALGFYARIRKRESGVEAGTYSVSAGMSSDQVLSALRNPVTVRITVPEYYWIARTAELMEKENIAKASEFVKLADTPRVFKGEVSFPLPPRSLEGYLFPDTYVMQPLVGAKAAMSQQLATFEKKVWKPLWLGPPRRTTPLQRTMIIASMIEREAKLDEDRPKIASVIENRLAKGMPLQIDATILYAQQKWHIPSRSDIKHTVSPYNTYLNKGLPPGPICSPALKSIKAALNPSHTNYLYYVAMPDGHSLFSVTLDEHNRNVAKRRRALKKVQRG